MSISRAKRLIKNEVTNWRINKPNFFHIQAATSLPFTVTTSWVSYRLHRTQWNNFLPNLVVYVIYINDARSSKYQIMKYICWLNTGCPRRNVPDFGRVFLMLKYTDINQNTYVQNWTVTEIMAREKCGLLARPHTIIPLSRHFYPSWQSLFLRVASNYY